MMFMFLGPTNEDLVNFAEVSHINKGSVGSRWRLTFEMRNEKAFAIYYNTEKQMETEWVRITRFIAHLPQAWQNPAR